MHKLLISFISLLLLSSCSFGPNRSRQFDYKPTSYSNKPATPTKLSTKTNDQPNEVPTNSYKDYGFSRLQKQDVDGKDGEFSLKIDKQEVSNFISYLVVKLPNIDDAATLVTDQEVLIAYQTDGNKDLARKQVEKTAQSALPSYYHIYTSDDMQSINNIEDLNKYGQLNDNQLEQKVQELSKDFNVFKESMHFDQISK